MSKIRYGKTINQNDYVTLPKNFHLNGSIRTKREMTFKVYDFRKQSYSPTVDIILKVVNPNKITSNVITYENRWGLDIIGRDNMTYSILKEFIETKKIRVSINKFSKSFMNTNPFSKSFNNELIHNQLDDLLL